MKKKTLYVHKIGEMFKQNRETYKRANEVYKTHTYIILRKL